MFRRRRISWLDADAVRYFEKAGITDPVEQRAANNVIVFFKKNHLWETQARIYLFSPTSITASLLCAKTFNSLINHSATFGNRTITTNGSSSYLETDIALSSLSSSQFSGSNASFSIWNFSAQALTKNKCIFGVSNAGATANAYYQTSASAFSPDLFNSAFTASGDPIVADTSGFYLLNRTSANQAYFYQNTLLPFINTNTETFGSNNLGAVYIGALNNNGVAANFQIVQPGFFMFGLSVPISIEMTFYNTILAYQHALGRV